MPRRGYPEEESRPGDSKECVPPSCPLPCCHQRLHGSCATFTEGRTSPEERKNNRKQARSTSGHSEFGPRGFHVHHHDHHHHHQHHQFPLPLSASAITIARTIPTRTFPMAIITVFRFSDRPGDRCVDRIHDYTQDCERTRTVREHTECQNCIARLITDDTVNIASQLLTGCWHRAERSWTKQMRAASR